MANPGYRGLSPAGADQREVATVINGILAGKLNATTDVTLTANVGSTVLTDKRIGADSFIGFMPQTANAAAEIGAGTLYVSARGDGTATLTHANNAQTDRTFTALIVG